MVLKFAMCRNYRPDMESSVGVDDGLARRSERSHHQGRVKSDSSGSPEPGHDVALAVDVNRVFLPKTYRQSEESEPRDRAARTWIGSVHRDLETGCRKIGSIGRS